MPNHFDESLGRYRLPLLAAPERVRAAVSAGVVMGEFPPVADARRLLGGAQPCLDRVVRAADGRVLITCCTDLPGVTPAMIDWWFGWHLPDSARYRLWHPTAHVKAVVREDRSHLSNNQAGDRARYIGNVSCVDEYIGATLKKLAIAFVDPAVFGIDAAARGAATAVCGTTSDRLLKGQGGCLVHYVVPTQSGAQMRSGFWLGDIQPHWTLAKRLLGGWLNRPAMRRLIVPDRMALDLLQHCGEEMNHLARFLPRLYADFRAQRDAA